MYWLTSNVAELIRRYFLKCSASSKRNSWRIFWYADFSSLLCSHVLTQILLGFLFFFFNRETIINEAATVINSSSSILKKMRVTPVWITLFAAHFKPFHKKLTTSCRQHFQCIYTVSLNISVNSQQSWHRVDIKLTSTLLTASWRQHRSSVNYP